MLAMIIDFHEYFTTVTDPAHVLTELTYAGIEVLVLRRLWNRWIKRHDEKVHGHIHDEETSS